MMAANSTNKEIIKMVNDFYLNVIDDFKEAEGIIINESKFKSIFKHKDHDRNIRKLRSCKKKCIAISTKELESAASSKIEKTLLNDFERTRYAFVTLCDAHIQLQQSLKDKSEGAKVKYSEYKEIYNRMQKCRQDLNRQLHELDIDYTDYTYDDGEEFSYEFLSYEDINK